MRRLIIGTILGLALAGCTSAPPPEQPAAANWAPCGGLKFNEGATSYARCIRYVATPAAAQPTRDSPQKDSRSYPRLQRSAAAQDILRLASPL